MGTSNWQNIPYCIDALMKMAPQRVLDVGVGFGRWGVVTREFCDVWYGRIFPEDWKVQVEGIEGFPRNIAAYHRHFYNVIHEGDAVEILPRLEGPWDVVIFGDVLEHFHKDVGGRLLDLCLQRSSYVMVNVPLGSEWPQDAAYGNQFERHLAEWNIADFAPRCLVRRHLFQDYIGRPFGTFILSREDPKNLAAALFSPVSEYDAHAAAPPALPEGEPQRTLAALQQLAGRGSAEACLRAERDAELAYIRQHRSYRLAERIRRSRLYRAARYARTGNARMVTIRALSDRNPASEGNEVWLLAAAPNQGAAPVPWDFVEADRAWELREAPDGAYGRALVANGGTLRIPVDHDPELRFVSHAWSGKVEITFGWRRETVDLYAPEGGQRIVRPAQIDLVTQQLAPELNGHLPAPPRAHAPAPAPALNGSHPLPTRTPKADPIAAIKRRGGAWASTFKAAPKAGEEQGPRAAAVCCPRWRGVAASTRALFEHVYLIPATEEEDPYNLPHGALEAHAGVLLDAGVDHLLFSGGDEAQLQLMAIVKKLKPAVRCDLVWHGNYTHFGDEYTWQMLTRWIDAARAGQVHTIATVKKGMEDFLARAGVRSHLLLNYIDGQPQTPPALPDAPAHIGIWLSGSTPLKTPYPMLAAAAFLDNARLHAAGVGPTARQVLDYFNIPVEFLSETPIAHADLAAAIRRTHLSIYATFVECCPMLPLESLSLGVPCLIGPSSHLFEDNEYLFSRLVVPFPDRAEVIAACAERAIAERIEIIDAYAGYARTYNERARQSVRELLNEEAAPREGVHIGSRLGVNGVKPVSV